MLLELTTEAEANLLLQIALERMFVAYDSFQTKTTTAQEEAVWLAHISQEIAFQNVILATIHFSKWLPAIESFSNGMRVHFTRCLRRNERPKPLPDWKSPISTHFYRTKGDIKVKHRHPNPWWNRLPLTVSKLKFDAEEMIQVYTSTLPSPSLDFDPEEATEEEIIWLVSKLPRRVDGRHAFSVLEAVQDQFESNRQSCVFKNSGSERKHEQAFSLD